MNILSFFVESIQVASKLGRADYQVDLENAERLTSKYCGGGRDWQGQSDSSSQDIVIRGPLPDRA